VSMILEVVILRKQVPNMFLRHSYFLSATQNGKLPPLPRSSENNGTVSTFIYLCVSGYLETVLNSFSFDKGIIEILLENRLSLHLRRSYY
jgi:hypothetical protein